MVIAFDIGGTKITSALIDNGHIIAHRTIPSVVHQDIASLPDAMLDLCQDWLSDAAHIAIACTGLVGRDEVNFLSIKQSFPLCSIITRRANKPVYILNDAAAAAWYEYHAFSSKHSDDLPSNILVYITVSTGIGAGIIQNGQLIQCDDGFCAHIGHVSVNFAGSARQCHCGRFNCAEALASGTAIAAQASEILNLSVSCKTVFSDYLEHPQIAQLLNHNASALCDLFANVKATSGTSVIVLGGSVGRSPYFSNLIKEKMAALPTLYHVDVLAPKGDAFSDLLGAYYFSLKQLEENNVHSDL